MAGHPSIDRLSGQNDLVEALGYGDVERAWARFHRLRDEHGSDPQTDIGAYFYLAGWEIGRDTLDQRIMQYANEFPCNKRTALRRGDRGAVKLATLIRDQAETNRPWGLITLFQSGDKVDFIVRLMMAYESWRPAEIRINGEDVSNPTFTLHKNPDAPGGYYHQLIANGVPLDPTVAKGSTIASLVVHWPMPVWPMWQTVAHVADPKIVVRTVMYRDRGCGLRLETLPISRASGRRA
jgi:hypothetical protein